MRFDQYSSFLQVAAALSLAGWVARTPDSNTETFESSDNYGYARGYQNQRYQPYSNFQLPQWADKDEFHGQSQCNPQNQYNNFPCDLVDPPYDFQYQSVEAEDNFRSYVELQELISWQEAFQRGDLRRESNYVLPASENGEPLKKQARTESNPSDDGYISGDVSVQSPVPSVFSASTSTSSASSFEDIPSPFSDQIFDSYPELGGAVGGDLDYPSVKQEILDFDIDEVLFGKDSVKPKKGSFTVEENSFYDEPLKNPFESLQHNDDQLEFVHTPLKGPSYDEFIASPNPSKRPSLAVLDNSIDDQFQMQFANASISENKFLSNTLALDLDEIDQTIIDEALAYDEELDRVLVDSLSGKSESSPSPRSPVIPCKNSPQIKEEVPCTDDAKNVFEHDFQQFKQEVDLDNYRPKDAVQFLNSPELLPNQSPIIDLGGHTFAPISNKNVKGKIKKQITKMSFIWPDFPYTHDEIIKMPVERFNEVIKSLTSAQQQEAKDIRRKGKNKLAARNCRKRKMDVIDNLDAGVESLEKEKAHLLEEQQRLVDETYQLKKGTEWLNDYIFQHLRDSNGSPYSSSEYSLQYTSDGNVYLVPTGQSQPLINVK